MSELKGAFNGICNITRCTTQIPATWYNASTRAYYCRSCARDINSFQHNVQCCTSTDHELTYEEKDHLNRELYKRLKP